MVSGALALLWFTMPALISIYLLANIGGVTEFLNSKAEAGILLAAAIFAVTSGLGLLPTYAQSIVVGWVFPFWLALGVAVVGYMGGAILGFGVSRWAAGSSVSALVDRKPQWMVVRKALVEASAWRTVGIVALVRFPPNSPFAFTNLVLAASGVKWAPMLLGSLLGMLPRTAIAVFIASQAAATHSKSLGELVERQGLWGVIAGLVVLVVAFVVLQQIGKRALAAAGLAPGANTDSKQVG